MKERAERMQRFKSEIDRVERLKADGMSAREIADLYDVAPCTVRRAVKEPFKHQYNGGERANIDFEMTPLKRFALCGTWK